MAEEHKNGKAAAFEIPDEVDFSDVEVVELPVRKNRDGSPVRVLVGSVDIDTFLMGYGGLPAIIEEKEDPDKVAPHLLVSRIGEWKGGAEKLARQGVIKPAMSFDAREPGKLHWHGLSFRDQTAIIAGINRASGFGRQENEEVRSFPGDEAERAVGGGDGEAGAGGEDVPVHADAGE